MIIATVNSQSLQTEQENLPLNSVIRIKSCIYE
jgi:hypothetical protein